MIKEQTPKHVTGMCGQVLNFGT